MFSRRDIPNWITLFRIALIPPTLWLMATGEFLWALLFFLIAGLSDGLDGLLARQFSWHSRLGSILDPIADKLLLVSSTITLAWIGLIPLWLVAAIVARDLLIVGGALIYHTRIHEYEMEPTIVSKINTFSQIIYVLSVVLQQVFGLLDPKMLEMGAYIVLTTTLISGADYIWTWGWRAWRESGHGKDG